MKAICIQARADSIVPSKSFANLRERLIQPRVRSAIHPFGRTTKPLIFFIRSLHNDDLNAARLEGSPLSFVAIVAPIGKSDLDPGAFAFYRPQNRCQRVAVLDIGGRDLALDRQAQCIHRNMPLLALDL
jgi:hypothetical protein